MKQTKFNILPALFILLFLIPGCAPKKHTHGGSSTIPWSDTGPYSIACKLKSVKTDDIIKNVSVVTDGSSTTSTTGSFSMLIDPKDFNSVIISSPAHETMSLKAYSYDCLHGVEFFAELTSTPAVSEKKINGILSIIIDGVQEPYPGVMVRCEDYSTLTQLDGSFRITGIDDPTPELQFYAPGCYTEINYISEIRDSSKLHVVLR